MYTYWKGRLILITKDENPVASVDIITRENEDVKKVNYHKMYLCI